MSHSEVPCRTPAPKTQDLTHTLVAGLKDMIAGGQLHPGSKLPPERELAKQFAVNRASVRQALKALEVMGILYQRVGDGTYLTPDASMTLRVPLDFLILVDGISFQELSEARRIVEPELAARAAARRSSEDVEALDEAVAAMKVCPDAEHDLRFHEVVWRASGNRVCQRMFSALHGALSGNEEVMPAEHERIAAAIREGDSVRARALMRAHLMAAQSRSFRASSAPCANSRA